MSTLLLNRQDVETLLHEDAALESLRRGFVAYSCGERTARRVSVALPGPGSAMVILPGLSEGIPAYSVKVHAKYPARSPAIRGRLLLHDLESGAVLCIMESGYLTAVRTGLAAALATHELARDDARVVAVVGAGTQGRFQLRYLARMRPLQRVHVYDTDSGAARRYCDEMAAELALDAVPHGDAESALAEAQIVLVATWAREPLFAADHVRPGTHVTSLGADQPGKRELPAALLREATLVCDDRALTLEMGAAGNAGLGPDVIDAELGEVLANSHPGRRHPHERTVFVSVGLAFQDLAVAWQVYRAALATDRGQRFDFGR